MKIFCAGAGGYIGMVLCKQLLETGHDVTAFDRYFFGHTPANCNIVVGDIRNIKSEALEGHDAVVDLAGLSNDATCEIDPEYTHRINKAGAKTLAVMANTAGIKRYVYASSASVYGHGESLGLTEESPVNPLTDYAKSKVFMEDWLLDDMVHNMEAVVLRNATVFGVSPRMRFDLAVNVMTMRAWRDKVIYVMGGGEQWRPFIHVYDVARAIIWALTAPKEAVAGQTFNVGSEENQCTIGTLANMITMKLPEAKIHRIPDNADERSYHLSFGKYRKAAGLVENRFPGIKTFVSVGDGILEVLDHLKCGVIDPSDPRTVTLNWYKAMLQWKQCLDNLAKNGPIL